MATSLKLVQCVGRGVATMATKPILFLDEFAARQFNDPNFKGTKIEFDKEEFCARANEFCTSEDVLVEGYAPFCKHLFVPNFVGAKVGYMKITAENEGLLKSDYKARTEKELPVLTRWFPADAVEAPVAEHLDLILYSREQIIKEGAAMGVTDKNLPDAPWGIISIKAQNESYETPMQPITSMRNCLGKEHGGSGVELDRTKYIDSVKFWKDHAVIS